MLNSFLILKEHVWVLLLEFNEGRAVRVQRAVRTLSLVIWRSDCHAGEKPRQSLHLDPNASGVVALSVQCASLSVWLKDKRKSGRCCSFHTNLKYSVDRWVCMHFMWLRSSQGFQSYYKSDRNTVEMLCDFYNLVTNIWVNSIIIIQLFL